MREMQVSQLTLSLAEGAELKWMFTALGNVHCSRQVDAAICNSWLCLEHPLPWQQDWRGSCREKGSRVSVPSCAMSCSLPPDRN